MPPPPPLAGSAGLVVTRLGQGDSESGSKNTSELIFKNRKYSNLEIRWRVNECVRLGSFLSFILISSHVHLLCSITLIIMNGSLLLNPWGYLRSAPCILLDGVQSDPDQVPCLVRLNLTVLSFDNFVLVCYCILLTDRS